MPKGKILLVDDEQICLEAHREELEDAGYGIKIALKGKEAIALAGREKFDIVYVDLILPDMNGVEICKEIKKISPNIEVVLISGHPEEIQKYKMQFLDAGGRDEILRKPLDDNELINLTKKIMNRNKYGQ